MTAGMADEAEAKTMHPPVAEIGGETTGAIAITDVTAAATSIHATKGRAGTGARR